MFNLGMGEILVLGAIALIVVGPEKLPGLARNVGRFINDLKRATSDVTREISRSIDEQNFQQQQQQTLSHEEEQHDLTDEEHHDHGNDTEEQDALHEMSVSHDVESEKNE